MRVRTRSRCCAPTPRSDPRFPFAPHGERTIAQAYERAFARARRLIYVEDQYFWSEVVTGALAEALRREPSLQVIAVVPRFPRRTTRRAVHRCAWPSSGRGSSSRRRAATRFAMYDLENAAGTPVYVHAKVCVVDDEWMTCGSDNLNLRSWTHDSEVTCAVVDPDGRLPRELRSTLWAEHLGLPRTTLGSSTSTRPRRCGRSVRRAGMPASVPTPRRPYAARSSGGRDRPTGSSSTPTVARGACAARARSEAGAARAD